MLARIRGNRNCCTELVSEATVESTVVAPQKVEQSYHGTQQSHCQVYTPEKWNLHPHENLYLPVCMNILHNNQHVKVASVFINWWWVSKMWCLPTVEWYLVMKRNGVLTHTTVVCMVHTRRNPEHVLLHDRSQSSRTTYSMNLFLQNIQNRHINRDQQ